MHTCIHLHITQKKNRHHVLTEKPELQPKSRVLQSEVDKQPQTVMIPILEGTDLTVTLTFTHSFIHPSAC